MKSIHTIHTCIDKKHKKSFNIRKCSKGAAKYLRKRDSVDTGDWPDDGSSLRNGCILYSVTNNVFTKRGKCILLFEQLTRYIIMWAKQLTSQPLKINATL